MTEDICDLTEDDLMSIKDRYPEIDTKLIVSFVKIVKRAFMIFNNIENFFALHDLSHGRFQMLISLVIHMDGTSSNPADLSKFHGVKPATVTRLLDGLERDGFIERNHDLQDRRKINVRLTKKGEVFMLDFMPKHYELISSTMNGLNDKQISTTVSTLDSMYQGVGTFLDGYRRPDSDE